MSKSIYVKSNYFKSNYFKTIHGKNINMNYQYYKKSRTQIATRICKMRKARL